MNSNIKIIIKNKQVEVTSAKEETLTYYLPTFEMVFSINRIHHEFSGVEGVDADAHKVGVVERRKYGEIHFVGHKQVCKTYTLDYAP